MEWKIGCAGYQYPEWRRLFYPDDLPQGRWFEYYATHFNTLELNATYYKFPRVELFRNWYDRSPQGFLFTVKAPRQITHSKKFKTAHRMLQDFYDTVGEGLGDKLGCVLFQFPSNFHYEAAREDRIITMLDSSVKNIVEFRHASWWEPQILAALARANISFCGMSHPTLPDKVVVTTDTVYYRFHGVPHLYNSKYEIQTLELVAHQILALQGVKQAYVYFNNTADGHAVTNAKQLQDICELVH